VGVSAATAEGLPELFTKIEESRVEFQESYLPDLLQRMALRTEKEKVRQENDLKKLQEVRNRLTLSRMISNSFASFQDIRSHRGDKLVVDAKQKDGNL
jgi:bifunctional N-acetylglucosamine-1-phosphate-uridyltransferase/glucosamine-1-phosphate-acetyltransferase GlmU-like protein